MNATGVLLLCRAECEAVAAPAYVLRERVVLAPAGPGWTVLVPEGGPWRDGVESVERVASGWASALAVGASRPVLALWWDLVHAGFTLASGFRRPVGYTWLADGTPAGEDEALLTFAERLGLDPVLDVQALQTLTRDVREADAHTRLVGLTAVLSRLGLALPDGVHPGRPGAGLPGAVEAVPGARHVAGHGWRDAVRGELAAVEGGRRLAGAQLAVGLPLLVWALLPGRVRPGWAVAGAVLAVQGALGLVGRSAAPPRPDRAGTRSRRAGGFARDPHRA
ncbi:hypothetical protein [Streptomyces sp. MUM 203J]|uniref:hypothetical protein n=1 Tax=Streptomyces sp. MUM 203J TaxID=2791990 RepID=UPI001F044DAF|nr:hypothetical protein [Streptomyces sp. MUM 203J]